MVEEGWTKEVLIDEDRKRNYLLEYKEQIMRICGGFYSDLGQMKKILSKDWPLGDHWFKLTKKGEEIAECSINPLTRQEKDKLDNLLEKISPIFSKKRVGAWEAFNSNNPDKLRQLASSMVELMNQVINKALGNKTLSEYLEEKYGTRDTKWLKSTTKWITNTKDELQRIKHHQDYKYENIVETLLTSTERIILIVLQ